MEGSSDDAPSRGLQGSQPLCGVHSQNHSTLTPGFLVSHSYPQGQMTSDLVTDESKGGDWHSKVSP